MSTEEIMAQLAAMGSESTRKTLIRHGAPEHLYGVKVGDMKTIVKKVKKNHALSIALFATGHPDAQYLAGLIADERQISEDELRQWAHSASWYMVSEYAVAWVAAESAHGWKLGWEWIGSDEERVAAAGWATLSSWVAIRPDDALDIAALGTLLDRVRAELHAAPNRVRYVMNGFVIAAGAFVPALTEKALAVAQQIGTVHVDMGGTACQVPFAPEYIEKVRQTGRIGVKKKMARC